MRYRYIVSTQTPSTRCNQERRYQQITFYDLDHENWPPSLKTAGLYRQLVELHGSDELSNAACRFNYGICIRHHRNPRWGPSQTLPGNEVKRTAYQISGKGGKLCYHWLFIQLRAKHVMKYSPSSIIARARYVDAWEMEK